MSAIITRGLAGGTTVITRGYGFGWLGGLIAREVLRAVSTIRRALFRTSVPRTALDAVSTIRTEMRRASPIDIEED